MGIDIQSGTGYLPMSLRLLGGFGLTSRSDPLRLSLAAQRLVATLALEPRPWSRRALAARLWPDHPHDRAQANLRSLLWRLSPDAHSALQDSPGTGGLTLGLIRVDVRQLTDSLRVGRKGGPDPETIVPLSTLRCDLLPGWDEEWVLVARERIRHLRLHALEARCLTYTQAGRYLDAVEAGTAAVAIEPLRESAHRMLIRAHLTFGNTYEAMRQYGVIERLLLAELDVRPSTRTQSLVAGLGDRTLTAL